MQFLRTYCTELYNLWHFCAIFVQSCDQKIALVFFLRSSCNSWLTQLLPNASLGFERTLNSLYLARS